MKRAEGLIKLDEEDFFEAANIFVSTAEKCIEKDQFDMAAECYLLQCKALEDSGRYILPEKKENLLKQAIDSYEKAKKWLQAADLCYLVHTLTFFEKAAGLYESVGEYFCAHECCIKERDLINWQAISGRGAKLETLQKKTDQLNQLAIEHEQSAMSSLQELREKYLQNPILCVI